MKKFVWAIILLVSLATSVVLAVQSVTLAWDHSPSPEVVGYNIYYGPQSVNYTNKQTTGYTNTTTVSNLIEGSTYYFAATAFDAQGLESDYSNEVSYMVPTNQPSELTLPSAVKDFAIMKVTQTIY